MKKCSVMESRKIFRRRPFGRVFYLVVMAITFVGALGWQMSTPMCSDDYVYALAPTYGEYSEEGFWNCLGEEYETIDELWRGIAGHALLSNARLTNLVFIPAQLMPLPVLKFVCGMFVWLMFAGLVIVSLNRQERCRAGLMVLAVVCFWFFFPWRDSMQSSDFIFNYPLVSAAMLAWIYFYERLDGMSRRGRIALALSCFVLSLLHEGFTIPLAFYVFTEVLSGDKRLRLYRLGLCAIMVAGVGTMLAMGTSGRLSVFDFSFGHYSQQLQWDKVKLVSNLLPGMLAVAWIAGLRLFDRGIDGETFGRKLWPLAGGIAGGALMCVVLGFYSRATWAVDIFTVMAFLRLGALTMRNARPGRVWKYVAMFGIVVYGAWIYELVRWQRAVMACNEQLVAELAPRGSLGCDVVYAPQIHGDDIPFYLMDIPMPVEEVMTFNNRTFAMYWVRRGVAGVLILPEEFRGMAPDSLRPIEGNAGFRGDYPYLYIDKPYKGHLEVRIGRFTGCYNPLMRALAELKPRLFGGEEDVINPYVETMEIMMADSTVRYMAVMPSGPRTARHREIMSIDTIAGGR
ncbi:MAG: hypothetical protein K2M06_03775 [Muribaculaceae bacterium]|nr:hypothetical protein [Muribaculaceae bacterium]